MALLAGSKSAFSPRSWAVLLIFLCIVSAIHAVFVATIKIGLPKPGVSVQQESVIAVDWLALKPRSNVVETNPDKALSRAVTKWTKSAKTKSFQSSANKKPSRPPPTEHPQQQQSLQPALIKPLPRAKILSTLPIREKNIESVNKSAILKAKDVHPKIQINLDTLQSQITQLGTEIRLNQQSAETSRIRYADQMSRNHFVAAQYVADWQKKVERTGNHNYPKAAVKKNFAARLVLDVGINIDGGIYSIRVSQSSGNPALDEAAVHIVKMSAPFPPLPLELSKELRVLVISKTWSFSDQSGMTTR